MRLEEEEARFPEEAVDLGDRVDLPRCPTVQSVVFRLELNRNPLPGREQRGGGVTIAKVNSEDYPSVRGNTEAPGTTIEWRTRDGGGTGSQPGWLWARLMNRKLRLSLVLKLSPHTCAGRRPCANQTHGQGCISWPRGASGTPEHESSFALLLYGTFLTEKEWAHEIKEIQILFLKVHNRNN